MIGTGDGLIDVKLPILLPLERSSLERGHW